MSNKIVEHGIDKSGTTAQRPSNAPVGFQRYNTDTKQDEVYNGSAWLGGVRAEEVTYTEDGAGTYTGSVTLPAGATLLDIIVNAVALWTAGTSASLEVGDATDPDGYYTAVDLKATDLLAGESLSFAHAGGVQGAYIANSHVSPRYAAAQRVITGTVVSVGAGTAGRTRMIVLYAQPVASAATKA